jgi:hypothetical protein
MPATRYRGGQSSAGKDPVGRWFEAQDVTTNLTDHITANITDHPTDQRPKSSIARLSAPCTKARP